MAGLSDNAKATTAFKKLIGLANTATTIPYYSESIPSQIAISSAEIIGEPIDPNPANATNVQFVDADLALIPSANGFSYRMVFPAGTTLNGLDVGGDPIADHAVLVPEKLNKTGFIQADGSGGYAYDLYNGGTRVSPLDSRLWVVDPIACIVTSEEPLNLGADGHIYVYVYTGQMLDDIVQGVSGDIGTIVGTTSPTFALDNDEDNHVVLTNNPTPANTAELQLWDADGNNLADLLVGNINGVDIQALANTVAATNTDNVEEGSTNFYFTDARAVDALTDADLFIRNDGDTAEGDYSFNGALFVIDQSGGVISSNGRLYVEDIIETPSQIRCGELIETSTAVAKTDITPMRGDMVDRLNMLNPVNFKWKSNAKDSFGFIAEEVEKIFPELVQYDREGKLMGMNYSKLVSVLVQNVKSLNKKNEELENKVARLEAKLV